MDKFTNNNSSRVWTGVVIMVIGLVLFLRNQGLDIPGWIISWPKTMSFFERTLDVGQFTRIHRSYIINLAQVTKIELKEKDSYIVLLKSDIWLPVSKTGYAKLKAALGI
ncbi:LytTR family DNA-binding domain-containing protein [Pedobacter sp. JCM 36344]|uniref:LytTR family DNA-binding domain-containing protein n=1 Tax=Pedobacter sp. JCM 36344 TaxID=3374280 RepID=UPI003979D642